MKLGHERRTHWRLAAAAAVLLAVGGCDRIQGFMRGNRCILSDREVHATMAVRLAVDGEKSGDACCQRCAVSYTMQTHRTVTILSVTDYNTRRRLRPGDAVYVVGSDVKPCSAPPVGAAGNRSECLMLSWDRCDPSIIAFASDAEAEQFRNEHGGQVETFQQIAGSALRGSIVRD